MRRARHMKREHRKMLCSWRRESRRVAITRIYEMQRTCVEQFGRECLLSENRRTALYHAMRASCEARKIVKCSTADKDTATASLENGFTSCSAHVQSQFKSIDRC